MAAATSSKSQDPPYGSIAEIDPTSEKSSSKMKPSLNGKTSFLKPMCPQYLKPQSERLTNRCSRHQMGQRNLLNFQSIYTFVLLSKVALLIYIISF